MKLRACVLGVVGVVAAFTGAASAQDCAQNVQPISIGSIEALLGGSSPVWPQGGDVCGESANSRANVYRFVASETRALVAQTCGGATAYDSVVSIHSACPPTAANLLACSDDACDLQSRAQANVVAGQTYYIRVAGYGGTLGFYTLSLSMTDPTQGSVGPDVIVGDITDVLFWSGGTYSIGTESCNIGDAPLMWIAETNQHPVIAQNVYRLKNGIFEQIGMSWLKHGFASVNSSLCGACIDPPMGSAQLGVGCSDPYGAGLNGFQELLGPRSHVNATTGLFPYPFTSPGAGYITPPQPGLSGRRISMATIDTQPSTNPGARYWAETQYVTPDDAAANNGLNNASAREMSFGATLGQTSFIGGTMRGIAAVHAWRQADPQVLVSNADYQDAGITARFHVASRAYDRGDGTWFYVYAVHNLNSHRSARALRIPLVQGASATSPLFHDIAYHSGEQYDGADWVFSTTSTGAAWASTQTFAQNQNANALRWATTYTFSFVSSHPPVEGQIALDLFRPGAAGDPDTVAAGALVPGEPGCVADLDDGSGTGVRDDAISIADLVYFLRLFEEGALGADIDNGSGTCGNAACPDGAVTIDDLLSMLRHFEAGC